MWIGHSKGLMTQWRLSEARIGEHYRFQRQYILLVFHMGSVMTFATNPGKPTRDELNQECLLVDLEFRGLVGAVFYKVGPENHKNKWSENGPGRHK